MWTQFAVATVVIWLETMSSSGFNNGTILLSGSNLEWPSVTDESRDIRTGRYDPRKILVHSIQMHNERAYVCMPRFTKNGVPWSLGVFQMDLMDIEPDIRPYPDYKYYASCDTSVNGTAGGTCIVNVVDAYIEDGTLWALDTGMTNVLRRPVRLGPAQLIGINLATDTVTRVTDLSPMTSAESVLECVVARRTVGNRTYVYVSDAGRHAIVVYDPAAGKLHTIPLPETSPVATHTRAVNLHLMPIDLDGKSYVYISYRMSNNVYALSSWSQECVTFGSVSEVGIKPMDMHVLGTDHGTNVYFKAPGHSDVWAWDVNRPLDSRTFTLVHHSYLYLIPTTVVAGWRNVVWALESNYDEYVMGNVDCTGPRTLLRPVNNQ